MSPELAALLFAVADLDKRNGGENGCLLGADEIPTDLHARVRAEFAALIARQLAADAAAFLKECNE